MSKVQTKTRESVGDLQMENGEMTTNNQEKADTLLKQFSSVFTIEPPGEVPHLNLPNEITNEQAKVIFGEEGVVLNKFKHLDPNKAMGPDGIHPRVLKECCEQLAWPFNILYMRSFKHGVLPDDWKTAEVTPIYKKDGKSKLSH